ncbi:hypothetical protein FOE78_02800 [Microlunatus elymi]|uniref:Uncharacterized protein n=1 Tax=Microlunatus elymi TaxID=2596828 RepID=A0A516PUX1_9ACTN|nr:hypothetical protein [Microlunatus elymi]QDP94986.1 hypothetical protein FOE78_02800 [Microlunatus elymi]
MIDWLSLLIVAVVSIATTAVFALLLAFAIRLLSDARLAGEEGRRSGPASVGGWTLLILIGMMIAFGLYLIIPQFH